MTPLTTTTSTNGQPQQGMASSTPFLSGATTNSETVAFPPRRGTSISVAQLAATTPTSISATDASSTSRINQLALETEDAISTARRISTANVNSSSVSNSPGQQTHAPIRTLLPSSLLQYENTCDPYAVEQNMKLMDKLYDASFYNFIKNDENVLVIARHLVGIARGFDIRIISNALRWLTNGWSLENIAKLLKLMTKDWSPSACGILVHLLTIGWDVKTISLSDGYLDNNGLSHQSGPHSKVARISYKQATVHQPSQPQPDSAKPQPTPSKESRHAILKLIAIMAAGESATVTAEFIHTLTLSDSWTAEKVTEMVSFLDAVLEWDEPYFQQFTNNYVELVYKSNPSLDKSEASLKLSQDQLASPSSPISPLRIPIVSGPKTVSKISFDYLAALYKTNLALANYRLALADFKMAVASRHTEDTEEPQQEQQPSTTSHDASNNQSLNESRATMEE